MQLSPDSEIIRYEPRKSSVGKVLAFLLMSVSFALGIACYLGLLVI